jgi:hypothetical protein
MRTNANHGRWWSKPPMHVCKSVTRKPSADGCSIFIAPAETTKPPANINGIFGQVESRLEEKENGFEVRSIENGKDWPRLKIQHDRWEKIFKNGENYKILICFAVPGIWGRKDEDQHDLYPEIVLWDTDHQDNWEYVKSKLPQWLKVLKEKDFNWTVYDNRNRPQPNLSADKIQSQPKSIRVWKNGDGFELKDKELLSTDVEALVNKLTDWVKQFAEAIDSLEAS